MNSSPLDPLPAYSSEPVPTVEEEESWLMPGAWLLDLMAEITLGSGQSSDSSSESAPST